jgi:hypothetical protein
VTPINIITVGSRITGKHQVTSIVANRDVLGHVIAWCEQQWLATSFRN